jgi:hypothetical protein
MCMMCEEDAIYSAYLEWKAQKEREEAAAAAAQPAEGQPAGPAPAPDASKFTCD